jgi:hypothetical protein
MTTLMAQIASHMQSELLSANDLTPMRRKIVIPGLINEYDMTGEPAGSRKIAKRNRLAEATDKIENVSVGNGDDYTLGSPVVMTPTGKEQAVPVSMEALTKRMPGASHQAVMDAIASGRPEAIPFIRDILVELTESHNRRDERECAELFSGITASAGVTNTAMSFATLLDAYMQILDGDPDSEDIVAVLPTVAIKALRSSLLTGTGTGLATIWTDKGDIEFFNHQPDASRNGYAGSAMGIPLFRQSNELFVTANGGVDLVAAAFVYGSGPTAKGGQRGFAEKCFGSGVRTTVTYDADTDTAKAIMRVDTDHRIHTQEHASKLIVKAT